MPASVWVTGVGAATSVGWTAASTAAAIRAGISMPRTLSEAEALDPDTQELVAIVGYPAGELTEGFTLLGRWFRLARCAVEDVLRSLGPADPAKSWQGARLILAAPAPMPDVFLSDEPQILSSIREAVALAVLEELALPIPPSNVELVAQDRVAPAVALQRAVQLLAAGCERVLVVAVDSLIDPLLLEVLAGEGRLKDDDQPMGLSPGEAAVALLLETSSAARRRQANPVATLRSIVVSPALADAAAERRTGRALAATIRRALDDGGVPKLTGDVYLDLNGEAWRAQQWGTALVQLQKRVEGPVVAPAESVGDIGVASAALGACLAIRSFARGHASADVALCVCASEDGGSAALVVGAPSNGGGAR